MNAKQDRQGVRTAAEIERKYDLGQESAAVNAAAAAQRAAERAAQAVEELGQKVEELETKLNQEELMKLLTNETNIISSADGTVQIDLGGNKISVNTLIINGKTASWKANDDGSFTLIGS